MGGRAVHRKLLPNSENSTDKFLLEQVDLVSRQTPKSIRWTKKITILQYSIGVGVAQRIVRLPDRVHFRVATCTGHRTLSDEVRNWRQLMPQACTCCAVDC